MNAQQPRPGADTRDRWRKPGDQRTPEADLQASKSPLEDYRELTLPQVMAAACERHGDQPAFSSLGQKLSFACLARLSEDFAAYLQCHTDLVPGDRIGIQLPNLMQYPIALMGALKAGLVVVNINPLYTSREMLHQCRDAEVRALLVLANFADKVEAMAPEFSPEYLIVTEVGDVLGAPRRWAVNLGLRYLKRAVPPCRLPQATSWHQVLRMGRKSQFRAPPLNPETLAILQYTGGTTGVPRGAMLSHRNLVANLNQIKAAIGSALASRGEVAIAPLPLYHIYSFTLTALVLPDAGVETVLIANPRDIGGFIRELRRHRFTLFSGLNTLFVGLLNHPEFARLDFSFLRITLSGGMSLTKATAERWQRVTGCPVAEGYGLTETSPVVALNPLDNPRQGSIGLPLPQTEVRVVDDDGRRLPAGGIGELCVRGPQVMQGYWRQPEETAAVLDADGWLRTGDVAQMAEDSYLRILDRKKDLIIVSGFNVYPGELEDVIASHPGVKDCAVVGTADPVQGERIKAFVVSRNPALSVMDIREYCRERLTAYKVPAQVEFRSELPKNNVGKVLRRALHETSPAADAGKASQS